MNSLYLAIVGVVMFILGIAAAFQGQHGVGAVAMCQGALMVDIYLERNDNA